MPITGGGFIVLFFYFKAKIKGVAKAKIKGVAKAFNCCS